MKTTLTQLLTPTVMLIVLSSFTFNSTSSTDAKELVGLWQDMPDIASGWSDTYQFFDDGKFTFHYNQMDCDKRVLSYSGTWKLSHNHDLTLTILERKIVEGGKLVPSAGSCGSDFAIEGGVVKDIRLKQTQTQTIQLSPITIDRQHRDYKTCTFDKKPFWKMNDDPASY